MSTGQQVMVVLGANIANFQSAMSNVQNSMHQATNNIQNSMNSAQHSAESGANHIKEAFKEVGKIMLEAFALDKLKDLGVESIEAAANAQAMNAQFQQVFGDMQNGAQDTVNELGKQFGMTPNRIKPAMSQMTSMFKGLGMNTSDAMGTAKEAVTATADAAAFYDKSFEEANSALNSFIKGNYDGGESIGLFANETQMASWASKNLHLDWNNLDEKGKQVARLKFAEAMQKASGAMGQASRESNSYENQLGNLKQSFKDLEAKLAAPLLQPVINGFQTLAGWLQKVDVNAIISGFQSFGSYIKDVLEPTFTDVKTAVQTLWDKFKENGGIDTAKQALDGLKTALSWIRDNGTVIEALIAGIVGGFVAFKVITTINTAIGIFNALMIAFRTGTLLATLAQWGLNTAMLANPFVWIAIGIGALIAIVILLWKNWDSVSKWLSASWQWIKDTASNIWNGLMDFFRQWGLTILAVIMGPIGILALLIYKNWDSIKSYAINLWNSIVTKISEFMTSAKNFIVNAWDSIKDKFTTTISNIVGSVSTFYTNIVQKFTDIKDSIVGKIKDTATDMKTKFTTGITDLVDDAKKIPGKIGDAISGAAKNAVQGVEDLGKKIIDTFKEKLGIHSPSKVFTELGGYVVAGLKNGLTVENIEQFASGIFGKVTSGAMNTWEKIKGAFTGGGKGVSQWASTATQALMMTGQYSAQNLQALLHQMQTESGGNAGAINLWDSNAKKGIPSKGLMQVIDPTFRSYAMKGYDSNIYDPLSNIIASIRYAVARYGSLTNAYKGHGYATGGIFSGSRSGSLINIAENGGDEAVLPLSNKTKMKPWVSAVASMMPEPKVEASSGFSGELTINIPVEIEGREVAKATVKFTQEELNRLQKRQSRLNGQYS